jgi:DNA-binding transcriptional LysR family regulator
VKDLSWDDVRLFLALSRARTVGQAARTLAIDASTASRRLASLETALGATLFARGRDGIAATKAGEDLLIAAEDVERGVARFANAVDSLERDVSGVVRVTCPSDVAEVIVAPLARKVLERYPRLRLVLDPGESLLDLTRREADIALRVVRPTRGDLVMTKVMDVRWIVVAAPELAKRLANLKAWSEAPWIGWSDRYTSVPAARWLAKHAPQVEPVLRSDSLTTQAAAARAGAGITLLPTETAAHYRLVPVLLAKPLRATAAEWPRDELFLVGHRVLRDVPRVRVVWDALAASFRDRAAK